jgi:tetratricopeptide (TPR) repeat protein
VGLEVKDPELVAHKLLNYSKQLNDSNLLESELRVSTEALAFCKASKVSSEKTLAVMYQISSTLSSMSRFPEAEIFARELGVEAEKIAPLGLSHIMAAQQLSSVLSNQSKYEDALQVAHAAVERFSPIAEQQVEAMVLLLEAESKALRNLKRYDEALVLRERCFLMQDLTSAISLHSYALLLVDAGGRLEEAEAALKKSLAKLKRDGIELHPGVVHATSTLGKVYWQQGRKKEAAAMEKAVRKLVPRVFPIDHPHYARYMGKADY